MKRLAFGGVPLVLWVTGIAFAADLKAPQCVEVEDAVGKTVGTIVSYNDQTLIVMVGLQVDGQIAVFGVGADGLEGTMRSRTGDTIVWSSADCSGTPHIQIPGGESPFSPVRRSAVSAPGQTLYLEMLGAAPVDLDVHSFLNPGDLVCNSSPSFVVPAVPAIATIDLGVAFTPPFKTSNGNCP